MSLRVVVVAPGDNANGRVAFVLIIFKKRVIVIGNRIVAVDVRRVDVRDDFGVFLVVVVIIIKGAGGFGIL